LKENFMVKSTIDVTNLHFSYQENPVLKQVSFSIMPGKFYGIMGANGAGKSTLLSCLSGYLPIQSGEIRLCEKKLGHLTPRQIAQKIAQIPQEYTFQFDFSVAEIVLSGRFPYLGFFKKYDSDDHEIARENMKLLDIEHLKNRPFSHLSGGEKQRVMIARAFTQKTPIIFLDEAASHLDLSHQIEMFLLLKEMSHQRGLTILFVSHDLSLTAEFADELILLHGHTILAKGATEEVLTNENVQILFGDRFKISRNPFTARPIVLFSGC